MNLVMVLGMLVRVSLVMSVCMSTVSNALLIFIVVYIYRISTDAEQFHGY